MSALVRAITVAIAAGVVAYYIVGGLSFETTIVALVAAILWVETVYNE